MEEQTQNEELLDFFKALADSNRLKIVGLLAQRSYTVEQLAALLDLAVSTTSHHLARLSKAGLVEAKTDGHYYLYSLRTDAIQEMAQRLLKEDELPKLSKEVDLDAYDRKVLDNFTDEEGRITAFPAQEKKFLAILRYVLRSFEPGRRYTEKEMNEILSRYNEDTAMLRRSMIIYKYMDREGGGGSYWLHEPQPE